MRHHYRMLRGVKLTTSKTYITAKSTLPSYQTMRSRLIQILDISTEPIGSVARKGMSEIFI